MVDDATIREWARKNGYQVGERGRLQENVKEAYYREFPSHRPLTNPNGTCGYCNNPTNDHRVWCSYFQPAPVTVPEWEEVIPEAKPEVAETVESTPTGTIRDSDGSEIGKLIPAPPIGSVEAAIRALVESSTTAVVDEELVRKIAKDEAETAALSVAEEFSRPQVFNIHFPDRATITLDERTHSAFEECLSVLMSGDNLFMVGPPGTGKTTLTKQLAKALGVDRRFISCSPDMSTTRLAGYMHATGGYVSTGCRDAFETGKLFLLDEGDKGNPGVLAWTHTALENGECEFPDAIVERHENNYWCVAANTYGRGATTNYIGSNKMDDAFIDRFSFVPLDIDEELEEALTVAQLADNRALAIEWLTKVRGWRANAESSNLSFLITPRASIRGAALIRQGMSFERVAELRVWKGIKAETRAKIERGY
jgi:MoxR-like ATPase